MMKLSLTDRRALLGRLALELTNKRSALTTSELARLKTLQAEMDYLESDIGLEQIRKQTRAFESWLVRGDRITQEERTILLERRDVTTAGEGVGTASAGGVLVPVGFHSQVVDALKDYGPLFRLGTVIQTERGNSLPFPSVNDTSISGEMVPEGSQVTIQDPASYSQNVLGAFKFSSRMVRVSIEFLQDQGVDFPNWLAKQFAIRINRAASQKFTTGVGTTEPFGVVMQATSAGVAVGASSNDGNSTEPNTLGTDDVATLLGSLDPQYQASARFLVNNSTLVTLRKTKDKQGRPVYPDLTAGGENRILNRPVEVSPFIDTLQTLASSPTVTRKPILCGDFSKYTIRTVTPTLWRLSERFSDSGQVAFLMFMRMDAALIDGGGNSVQYLTTIY